MKSALAALLVFFGSLALNWSIKTELPDKNGITSLDSLAANTLLAISLAVLAIVFLQKIFRQVRQSLIDAGVLHGGEQLVSWRYSLLAPLPCLVMFRYSWMTEEGKRLLEYGGSMTSTLAYVAGVTALLAFQVQQRLSQSAKKTIRPNQ